MADYSKRISNNTEGMFYVDNSCINCGVCAEIAPDIFFMDVDFTYVHRQPMAQDEIDLCKEAMESCPVDAIGDDGPSEAHHEPAKHIE